MIGYNTLSKSMNGVKVLTDGVSFISDGDAEHNNIVYNEFIESNSGQTILNNDSLNTINVTCTNLTATDFDATNIDAENIEGNYLEIKNKTTNNSMIIIDGITNNNIVANVPMTLNNQLSLVNYDLHQTQTGRIYQQGTNNNYLKDTYINGYLEVGSNITQSGGSTSLKDLTIDSLTMRTDKSISQTGTNVSNSLAGTTTLKNVIITDSVVLPANIEIPDFTTNDDIIMTSDSVIIQDVTTTTTNKNIFRNTKTLDLEVDGNLSQIKAGATTTLKNTTIQGTAEIQGDITQTAGTTVLKTLRCNNITLNDDQLVTMSGTGYITQSGTGTNTMKAITLLSNANLTFQGSGIISQALSGINILSHFRSAGWGIIGGRNNTTFTNYQNIQNNNGLQIQFNRDNSTQYSFLMNNRGTGGNGGFRFQRYITGVYVDEPLVIDDNITMNKNLSIPGGSLTCSSATIGNISQTELDCLDNCNQNINNKFISLDSQIANLQTSSAGNTTALSGISYTSVDDTTLIDNNLKISDTKNLLYGTRNIMTELNANTTNISTLTTRTSGMTYTSATDFTVIDNNVRVGYNKKLYIGDMDVGAEITALETSFTTGTLDATNISATNIDAGVLNVTFSTTTADLTATGVTAIIGDVGISGGTLNVYNNSLFNSTVTVNNTSDFYNIATFHSNILASSNIQLKQRLNIGAAKNINTNLSLTFPLDEYNIINQSVNITITLPSISSTSYNGVVTTFILNVKTANATLTTPAGTNFYDINNNLISNIVLSGSTYLNVKVYASNNHWYIFDYITNPNTINTTTLNSTTINNSGTATTNTLSSSTINNSGGITTNTTTVTANATINNNLYVKNNIKSRSLIPGYMFDGANSFLCYPIPCSMKGFRPADVDDYFLINPGFQFAVYENDNYGGNQFILSNDSDSPIVYPATNVNKIGSIKVLYRNQSGDTYTEITMQYIS